MTLFKNLFIGFILFCSSSTCFAIGGQLLDPSEIPKSLCKIEFKEKGETGSCSGVLISPNQVMTAEHCLISDTSELYVPLKKYRIQCGDETFKVESSLKNDENAMLLKRLMNGANTIATQSQAVSSDVVILNLKKNSNTPFMNHLSGFETQLKFFDHGILRENVECRFAGNATGPKSAVFEIGGTSNYQLKVIQGFHSVLLHQPESFPVDQESFQIRDGINL